MSTVRFAVVAAFLALASSPALTQMTASHTTPTVTVSDVLAPGDIVRLRIWREPDLSGEFAVDESGIATFPKIGPLDVLQQSSQSLKETLLARYDAYLINPSVEVTILRRINVLGAVQKPGLYPLDGTMTVADALAAAGGATANGDQRKVELLRNGVRVSERIDTRTKIGESPLRSGDQLFVPERGFVVRNSALVASAISVSTSLIIALFIRH